MSEPQHGKSLKFAKLFVISAEGPNGGLFGKITVDFAIKFDERYYYYVTTVGKL